MAERFTEDQVEAIARALGDTENVLSNTEIDSLLQQSKIQDDHGPGTKWRRLRMNMWNQQLRDGHLVSILAFIRNEVGRQIRTRNYAAFATCFSISSFLIKATGER